MLLRRVKHGRKLDTRQPCCLSQFNQHTGLGDITPLLIESLLNQLHQLPGAIGGQAASRHHGPTGGLGVIDKTVRQGAVELEWLPGGVCNCLPVFEDIAPGSRLKRRATAGAQTAHHQMQLNACGLRLLNQRLGDGRETPAP